MHQQTISYISFKLPKSVATTTSCSTIPPPCPPHPPGGTLYNVRNFFMILDVHDAMEELKDVQMDNGDGDTLLGIGRALGATLESVAQGGSSVIKAIGLVVLSMTH